MKSPNAIRALTVAAIALLLGMCGRHGMAPTESGNLLTNGSFESNGQPSLVGWLPANPQLAALVTTPAPGGGSYALQLEADWAPTLGFVTAAVDGLHDGETVRLSAYVRAIGKDGGGFIALTSGSSAKSDSRRSKSVEFSDTNWIQISLIDTLQLDPGDSVWVRLSSPNTEVVPRMGQFDLVTFQRLSN